jgi:hypothetical protein
MKAVLPPGTFLETSKAWLRQRFIAKVQGIVHAVGFVLVDGAIRREFLE